VSDNYVYFPRLFAKYVRDEGLLTLEDAVRKMTSLPAQRLGIRDRRLLRKGMWADIVISDMDTIDRSASFMEPDAHPEGTKWVLVKGEIVVAKGEHTGGLPGTILRKG
jgi:N-acyl-D-aspartate/D-glutamate deacylase